MGVETEELVKTDVSVEVPDVSVEIPEAVKSAETKVETQTKVEETKVPEIDWEQKYKEYQKADFVKTNKWKREIAELKEMVAAVQDAQQEKELDDSGNIKQSSSPNTERVRQSNYLEVSNETATNISGLLKEYGIANNDQRLELAAELWAEGDREKNVSKILKAEKAVRMLVTMIPNPQQTPTPKEKTKVPDVKPNPDLFKVDTHQFSEGAAGITDKAFEEGWGNGSIPWSEANQKRANRLLQR